MLKRLGRVVGAAISGVAMVVGGFSGVAHALPATPTCSGPVGPAHFEHLVIPAGASCTIAGAVSVDSTLWVGAGAVVFVAPTASLHVDGALIVGAGAVFADPQNSSPVDIDGPVGVLRNGVFLVGTETPGGPVVNRIDGFVVGFGATAIQIHNASIDGPVFSLGGGVDNPVADKAAGGQPVNFNDLEDNRIDGGVLVNGYHGIWAGIIRNHIDGRLVFTNNADQDEFDIGSNVVDGSATCAGNNPAVNTGGSPGSPNTVEGLNTCG